MKFKLFVGVLAVVTVVAHTAPAHADGSVGSNGGKCADQPAESKKDKAKQSANILQMAGKLYEFLEKNAKYAALVARAGGDLSSEKFKNPSKQKYTHIGIAVRDTKNGGWKFTHLLNTCAGPTSDIYDQGLGNFFSDDPFFYDVEVTVPSVQLQRNILRIIDDKTVGSKGWAKSLHYAKYSNVANPFSTKYQNSNMWVLSVLAAAQGGATDRATSQEYYQKAGYVPSQVRVGAWRQLLKGFDEAFGSKNKPNTHLDDHPEASSGWVNFVSADSLVDYLQKTDKLTLKKEICHDAGCNVPVSKLE